MVSENNHHSGKRLHCSTFFVVLSSLLTGIFIGFLIAPQSGRRFRENLRNWLDEMVERGKFTLEEAKVYGNEFLEKSKEKAESFSSRIKSDFKD